MSRQACASNMKPWGKGAAGSMKKKGGMRKKGLFQKSEQRAGLKDKEHDERMS